MELDAQGRAHKAIGRVYLDLYPREGKFKHAAMFPMRQGLDGVQLPEAALVCNFPHAPERMPYVCPTHPVCRCFTLAALEDLVDCCLWHYEHVARVPKKSLHTTHSTHTHKISACSLHVHVRSLRLGSSFAVMATCRPSFTSLGTPCITSLGARTRAGWCFQGLQHSGTLSR